MSLLDEYHRSFYDRGMWITSWMGVEICKYPTDLFIYHEIIYKRKPDLIIETGTYRGGSAWFFASIMDMLGKGRILSIDVTDDPIRPAHPRITYLRGDSIDRSVFDTALRESDASDRVMVVLDSDHHEPHVAAELELYPNLVTPGDYLVVEDTNLNGHPVYPDHGPGPWEALQKFLSKDDRFTPDPECERFGLTSNPGGWLRRNNWK
jgi:cephalosporin hydroxylase